MLKLNKIGFVENIIVQWQIHVNSISNGLLVLLLTWSSFRLNFVMLVYISSVYAFCNQFIGFKFSILLFFFIHFKWIWSSQIFFSSTYSCFMVMKIMLCFRAYSKAFPHILIFILSAQCINMKLLWNDSKFFEWSKNYSGSSNLLDQSEFVLLFPVPCFISFFHCF